MTFPRDVLVMAIIVGLLALALCWYAGRLERQAEKDDRWQDLLMRPAVPVWAYAENFEWDPDAEFALLLEEMQQ